jgi:hypothetical protein
MAVPRASTIRPTTWMGTAQAVVLFGLFTVVSATLVGEWIRGLLVGSVAFTFYRVAIVRFIICRHHRSGVALTRSGRFHDAVQAFRRSAAFWHRWAWLDRLRGLLLGSSVSYPFGQLARYNQAYCYSRMGRDEEARDLLRALIQDAPQMPIATELLGVLDAEAVPPAPAPSHDASWGGMLGEALRGEE